ncbi:MAG: peptidylprolyl isomerase [Candidatus Firestonebacteria bacterium]
MMKFLRNNMKIIFWVVVVCFLATIFLVWGMKGEISTVAPNVLAIINGKELSLEIFNSIYTQKIDELQKEFKGEVPEFYEGFLRKQILNSLITRTLLLEAVNKYKIHSTEEEIRSKEEEIKTRIRSFFYVDGKFDKKSFERAVKSGRIPYDEIINQEKTNLILSKLERMIKDTAKVTEEEIKEEYLKNKEKRKVKYIKIDVKNYLKNISIIEDDLKKHYEQNINSFKIPEKFKVKYIFFGVNAKEKAKSLIGKLKAGTDFATLAKENSDDPGSKDKGGDLGFFKKGVMVKEFDDVAFNLKVGEITNEPVKTQFGFHIIKVEEKKDDEIKARHILIKLDTDDKIKASFKEKAENIHKKIISKNFEVIAKENSLSVKEISFTKEEPLKDIPEQEKFKNEVFNLKPNEISTPVETENGYYLIKLMDKIPENIKPLETVKNEIQNKIKLERALPLAGIEAEKLYKKIFEEKSDFDLVCKQFGIKETDYFDREGKELKNIDHTGEFTRTTFKIANIGEIGKIVKTQEGCYLLKLTDKKLPDEATYLKEKETIKTELLTKKQNIVFSQWLENLRKNAKIKDYSDRFFKE